MSSGTPLPLGYETLFDSNGDPVSGGLVYTYLAGTVTPQATWTTSALTVQNANPIVTDSAGRWKWFGAPGTSYDFTYKTAAGVLIITVPNVPAVPGSSNTVDVVGTAGEALSLGSATYLSAGDGGKTVGLWYLADSANGYSSDAAVAVGMATAAISLAASGTIRMEGQVTGLTVVAGSTYYVGTAGAITTTAPSHARRLGIADSSTSLILAPQTAQSTDILFIEAFC